MTDSESTQPKEAALESATQQWGSAEFINLSDYAQSITPFNLHEIFCSTLFNLERVVLHARPPNRAQGRLGLAYVQ